LLSAVLSGKRLALFGPWLLLFLTATVGLDRGRITASLAALAFAMGWLGVVTGRYKGTHRYTEPWREAAIRAVQISTEGDTILCSHPSFYFYLSYAVPWPRERALPWEPFLTEGRTFVPVENWRAAAGAARLIYVRTVLMPRVAPYEEELLAHLSRAFRPTEELRYEQDAAAPLKRRFFPGVPQPEWRIRIQVWERAREPSARR
jgi:hypothetical protein